MKELSKFIFVLGLVLVLSFSFVSAGFFGDLFGKITGNLIEEGCGDGVIAVGAETCDDGNSVSGDGCSSTCQIENGWSCLGEASICTSICSDDFLVGEENCYDDNLENEDGCSSTCQIENGWSCVYDYAPESYTCSSTCGDGVIAVGAETCDDGNSVSGDGCSSTCQIESGWSCLGEASICTSICSDDFLVGEENCYDDNLENEDGCSSTCQIENGWSCVYDYAPESYTCSSTCGDGVIAVGAETCDDGNSVSGDGCSSTCQIEECLEEEICFNGIDDDCNLEIDEGCPSFSIQNISLNEKSYWEDARIPVTCIFSSNNLSYVAPISDSCINVSIAGSPGSCSVVSTLQATNDLYYRVFECGVGDAMQEKDFSCYIEEDLCGVDGTAYSRDVFLNITSILSCPPSLDSFGPFSFSENSLEELKGEVFSFGENLNFSIGIIPALFSQFLNISYKAILFDLDQGILISQDGIKSFFSEETVFDFTLNSPENSSGSRYRIYSRLMDDNSSEFCILDKYDLSFEDKYSSSSEDYFFFVGFSALTPKSVNISEDEEMRFSLNGSQHTLNILDLGVGGVKIEIRSTPIIVNLIKGGERKIDLDGDGKMDFLIKLINIFSDKALFYFKPLSDVFDECSSGETKACITSNNLLGEKVCVSGDWGSCIKTISNNGGISNNSSEGPEKIDSGTYLIIAISILILLIIMAIVLHFRSRIEKEFD